MTLTLSQLVKEAREEFTAGAEIDVAVRAAITKHGDELCAKGCKLTLELMPSNVKKPTDLWFITFPLPYVILNLEPYVLKRLHRSTVVKRELARRRNQPISRDRFKFRPLK